VNPGGNALDWYVTGKGADERLKLRGYLSDHSLSGFDATPKRVLYLLVSH
jgi:hypothetical protein